MLIWSSGDEVGTHRRKPYVWLHKLCCLLTKYNSLVSSQAEGGLLHRSLLVDARTTHDPCDRSLAPRFASFLLGDFHLGFWPPIPHHLPVAVSKTAIEALDRILRQTTFLGFLLLTVASWHYAFSGDDYLSCMRSSNFQFLAKSPERTRA